MCILRLRLANIAIQGAPNTAPAAERLEAFGRDSMVNVWTGFVPVGLREGGMLMLPGTHKLGCVEHVLQGLARAPRVAPEHVVGDTMADDADVDGYSKNYQTTHKTYVVLHFSCLFHTWRTTKLRTEYGPFLK